MVRTLIITSRGLSDAAETIQGQESEREDEREGNGELLWVHAIVAVGVGGGMKMDGWMDGWTDNGWTLLESRDTEVHLEVVDDVQTSFP